MKNTTAQEVEQIVDTKLNPILQRLDALESNNTPTYYTKLFADVIYIYDQTGMIRAAIARVVDRLDKHVVGYGIHMPKGSINIDSPVSASSFTCIARCYSDYAEAEKAAYTRIKKNNGTA